MHDSSLLERFWAKVAVAAEDECWNWTAYRDNYGYGRIGATGTGRNIKAHRLAYEIRFGSIPRGLVVDHLCRNRGCVNPGHLEAVTNEENLRRGSGHRPGRGKDAVCIRGHALAPENVRIDNKGARRCRTCDRAHSRAQRERMRQSAA